MKLGHLAGIGLCLITFHNPDGSLITVDTHHIIAVRPVLGFKEHLAPGTNTVVYVTGHRFGIKETQDEVEDLINSCAGD